MVVEGVAAVENKQRLLVMCFYLHPRTIKVAANASAVAGSLELLAPLLPNKNHVPAAMAAASSASFCF